MATSQNGWSVLPSNSGRLYTWTIPAKNGHIRLRLRNGSAGFLICHILLWLAERIEPLAGKITDDWGYAYRPVRGSSSGYSNHASGTAADANAPRHWLGQRGTFRYKVRGRLAEVRIRARLRLYGGVIRWGGDYQRRADEMHFEINRNLAATEKVARALMSSPRGRRILKANPGQRRVILS